MATKVRTEELVFQHDPAANLETDLALEFLGSWETRPRPARPWDRATASTPTTPPPRPCAPSWILCRWMGRSSSAKGERDEAPMLYIGEKVGKRDGGSYPQVDIAG